MHRIHDLQQNPCTGWSWNRSDRTSKVKHKDAKTIFIIRTTVNRNAVKFHLHVGLKTSSKLACRFGQDSRSGSLLPSQQLPMALFRCKIFVVRTVAAFSTCKRDGGNLFLNCSPHGMFTSPHGLKYPGISMILGQINFKPSNFPGKIEGMRMQHMFISMVCLHRITITISWMLKRIEDMIRLSNQTSLALMKRPACCFSFLAGSDVADLVSSNRNIHSSYYKTSWKHGSWKKSLEDVSKFCHERANQSLHLQDDAQSIPETGAERTRVDQATCTATRFLWSCIHTLSIYHLCFLCSFFSHVRFWSPGLPLAILPALLPLGLRDVIDDAVGSVGVWPGTVAASGRIVFSHLLVGRDWLISRLGLFQSLTSFWKKKKQKIVGRWKGGRTCVFDFGTELAINYNQITQRISREVCNSFWLRLNLAVKCSMEKLFQSTQILLRHCQIRCSDLLLIPFLIHSKDVLKFFLANFHISSQPSQKSVFQKISACATCAAALALALATSALTSPAARSTARSVATWRLGSTVGPAPSGPPGAAQNVKTLSSCVLCVCHFVYVLG